MPQGHERAVSLGPHPPSAFRFRSRTLPPLKQNRTSSAIRNSSAAESDVSTLASVLVRLERDVSVQAAQIKHLVDVTGTLMEVVKLHERREKDLEERIKFLEGDNNRLNTITPTPIAEGKRLEAAAPVEASSSQELTLAESLISVLPPSANEPLESDAFTWELPPPTGRRVRRSRTLPSLYGFDTFGALGSSTDSITSHGARSGGGAGATKSRGRHWTSASEDGHAIGCGPINRARMLASLAMPLSASASPTRPSGEFTPSRSSLSLPVNYLFRPRTWGRVKTEGACPPYVAERRAQPFS